jgi:uncharacterized protein YcnI
MDIGLSKSSKTFSRDAYGISEKQFKAFSRDGNGPDDNCFSSQMVRQKGTAILTEIEIPTIVHSKAEMNIGLSIAVKTFSRDGRWTFKKQYNFQQRCL